MDVSWNNGVDHFAMYVNTKSLHCTLESNINVMSIIPQLKRKEGRKKEVKNTNHINIMEIYAR